MGFMSSLPLQLGGVGGFEWFFLILIALLLLFGAKKLPELARSLGRATGEFRRGRKEIEDELSSMAQEEREKALEDRRRGGSTAEPRDVTAGGSTLRAARELGIETEGKTEEEIRREMVKKLSERT